MRHGIPLTALDFNPRPPHGERRLVLPVLPCNLCISTHAPRTGSDVLLHEDLRHVANFNPRPPHGERHFLHVAEKQQIFISTHAPRTGSDYSSRFKLNRVTGISTHAPRTGSDFNGAHETDGRIHFNPRPPHGERLRHRAVSLDAEGISTHAPRTGSDNFDTTHEQDMEHFNPRPPHGERPLTPSISARKRVFQPTLPARGATLALISKKLLVQFQPTLPARGATVVCDGAADGARDFNPRSPHGERRTAFQQWQALFAYFNPRSPHGERHASVLCRRAGWNFNPRSPHGERRSCGSPKARFARNFNPRSPHGERRCWNCSKRRCTNHFNPRSPHGERLERQRQQLLADIISTHAPRTGSDRIALIPVHFLLAISTHAPRTGSDCWRRRTSKRCCLFQPTLPARGATIFTFAKKSAEIIFQPTLPARGATQQRCPSCRVIDYFNPRSPHGERRP